MLRIATMVLAGIAVLAALGGCEATMHTADGGGTYLYERPWLESIETASLDKTWKATQDAMADLEFDIEERAKDSLQAKLLAKQATGESVQVRLNRLSDESTKVRVKVGSFGDRSVSELVLNKIRDRLEDPRPASESGGGDESK